VDIKSVGLLPNAIAKQKAKEAGAREAWFVDHEGFVTEGSSTTAWIVTVDGKLVTRPNGADILPGITRITATEVARRAGLEVQQRKFTVAEAQGAREAFMTAASTLIMPVVRIDGQAVANGRPGTIAGQLRAAFHDVAEKFVDCNPVTNWWLTEQGGDTGLRNGQSAGQDQKICGRLKPWLKRRTICRTPSLIMSVRLKSRSPCFWSMGSSCRAW
jgi:hypothetical protein